MLASFLKRDLRNLFRKDASPNFQAQNGLLSLRSRWRSVRSLFISPSPTVELGCRRQRQSRRVENVGQQPHVVLGFAFGRNTDQSARNRRLAFLPSVLRPVENGAFAPGLEFRLLHR